MAGLNFGPTNNYISTASGGKNFVAIAAHHDCAATILPDIEHRALIKTAIKRISQWKMPVNIIGIWVNSRWEAEEIDFNVTEIKKGCNYELFCKV